MFVWIKQENGTKRRKEEEKREGEKEEREITHTNRIYIHNFAHSYGRKNIAYA
jgi:hypothetical protein